MVTSVVSVKLRCLSTVTKNFFPLVLGICALGDVGGKENLDLMDLVIDKGLCDMLDIARSLHEEDEDNVLCLDIKLGESSLSSISRVLWTCLSA